jgi:hypothetical protein
MQSWAGITMSTWAGGSVDVNGVTWTLNTGLSTLQTLDPNLIVNFSAFGQLQFVDNNGGTSYPVTSSAGLVYTATLDNPSLGFSSVQLNADVLGPTAAISKTVSSSGNGSVTVSIPGTTIGAESSGLFASIPGSPNSIAVTETLSLSGSNPGIQDFQNNYTVVPEPTTMIAGTLLLLPFGASTMRVLRRNRTA